MVLIQVQIVPGYEYDSPTYHYQGAEGKHIKISMNGPLWFEPEDLENLYAAALQAQRWLKERYP